MMETLNRYLRLLGILVAVLAFLAINIAIGIAVLSAMVVPLTYLYCLLSGKSYNSFIDTSQIIYTLNKIGQWTIISALALLIVIILYKTFI